MIKLVQPRGLLVIWYFLLIAPSLAGVGWTVFPTLGVLAAMANFSLPGVQALEDEEWQEPSRTLEIRRAVQKHFRAYSVYIPLEDILTPASDPPGPEDVSLLMQKTCGRGKLYVWLPFKFNLPVIGEKVFEWCWKPQLKTR